MEEGFLGVEELKRIAVPRFHSLTASRLGCKAVFSRVDSM